MSTDFKTIDALASEFAGWLTPTERKFLYNAAKRCEGKGVIVEIGSWQGKSTSLLAAGSKSKSRAKVYAIDPHINSYVHVPYLGKDVSTLENFRQNIKRAQLEDMVEPIVKLSSDARKGWKQQIELLWIDGEHSYEGAKLDFDLFDEFLVDGGVAAFHDATFESVKSAVKDVLFKSGRFARGGVAGSIVYATKTASRPLTFFEKLHNAYVVSLIDLHDWARGLGALRAPLKKAKALFDRA